jgi:hypothetical protein
MTGLYILHTLPPEKKDHHGYVNDHPCQSQYNRDALFSGEHKVPPGNSSIEERIDQPVTIQIASGEETPKVFSAE